MKPLSKLTERFNESVIREMTRICMEADGINLSQGLPEFPTPTRVMQAAIRAIRQGLNQYPITFGESVFRDAIAAKAVRYNRIRADPATDITVTCGATEAMLATLRALINPGDEMVLFEPYYENYGPDGILSGAKARYVSLKAPSWQYDSERLKEAIRRNTKVLVINTPNNPTGKVFQRAELKEIRDLCVDHDLYAVTDEIYEHILYDENKHLSLASFDGMEHRSVTISALSKTYNVTGWRVGWAIANKAITARIRKVHDFLTVGAPTPFQHAGVVALRLPDSYYRTLALEYAKRRNFLLRTLTEAGFEGSPPAGAYYIMAGTDGPMKSLGARDDHDFARKLITATGVAVVPGSSFTSKRSAGHTLARFTFCKTWRTLRAVRRALQGLGPAS